MDAVILIERARDAGLQLRPEGDKLHVSGPKDAEPIVRELAQHKAEVLLALEIDNEDWGQHTSRLIAQLHDRTLQLVLTAAVDEFVVRSEYEHGKSRQEARMLAFGFVMFEALKHQAIASKWAHEGVTVAELNKSARALGQQP